MEWAHILLADGNHDLREYAARILRRWWNVDSVGDGATALETIRRQRPTLVLADAALPGLDGIGLLQMLRNDPVTRSIPVIVLSEHSGADGVGQLRADDCLMKPFSSRELVGCVSARLEEHFGISVRAQKPVRRLLNKIDLPIAVLRSDGLIVENANHAYFDLAGGREAIGKPFAEPRDRELEDARWSFVFAPVKDEGDGRNRRVVAIGVKTTDDVRARYQREALAAEANRANIAKDQFLATLGHELRGPLSPILAALQLMRVKGLCTRELDVVERQVNVLVRLVDDLLDVARIGHGQLELRKERVGMSDLVTRARETVDSLLTEREHRLALLVSGPGLHVNVDPARMTQVIANLLTNAAKYSERGSEITVRAERNDQQVRISVEDRGIGIAADMLPHVFEAFAQERSAVRRSRGGLGLGLAIVRNLVEAHGGRVTAHSDGLGSGSTFSVDLPAANDGDVVHDDEHASSGGAR